METSHQDHTSHRSGETSSSQDVSHGALREAEIHTPMLMSGNKQPNDCPSNQELIPGHTSGTGLEDKLQQLELDNRAHQMSVASTLDMKPMHSSEDPQNDATVDRPASAGDGEQCDFSGVAARFVNRPDGTPLATIIERNSCSTLNSKASSLPTRWRYTRKEIKPIYEGYAESATPKKDSRKDQDTVDNLVAHQKLEAVTVTPKTETESEADRITDYTEQPSGVQGCQRLQLDFPKPGRDDDDLSRAQESMVPSKLTRNLYALISALSPFHGRKPSSSLSATPLNEQHARRAAIPPELGKAYWQVVSEPSKVICEMSSIPLDATNPPGAQNVEHGEVCEKKQEPFCSEDHAVPSSSTNAVSINTKKNFLSIYPPLSLTPFPSPHLMVSTVRSPAHSLSSSVKEHHLQFSSTCGSHDLPVRVVSANQSSQTSWGPFLTVPSRLSQEILPESVDKHAECPRVGKFLSTAPAYGGNDKSDTDACPVIVINQPDNFREKTHKAIRAPPDINTSAAKDSQEVFNTHKSPKPVSDAHQFLSMSNRIILDRHGDICSGISTADPFTTAVVSERVIRFRSAALPVLLPIAAAEGIVRPVSRKPASTSHVSRESQEKVRQLSPLATGNDTNPGHSCPPTIHSRLHGLPRLQKDEQADHASRSKKENSHRARKEKVAASTSALQKGGPPKPQKGAIHGYAFRVDGGRDSLIQLEPIATEAPIPATTPDEGEGLRYRSGRRLGKLFRACFCRSRGGGESDTEISIESERTPGHRVPRKYTSAP